MNCKLWIGLVFPLALSAQTTELFTLEVARIERSAVQPWRREPVVRETRLAVPLAGGRLLVTEFRGDALVSLSAVVARGRYDARTTAVDRELRLAVATTVDPIPQYVAPVRLDWDPASARPGMPLRRAGTQGSSRQDLTFVYEGTSWGKSPDGNTDIPVLAFSGWSPFIRPGDLLLSGDSLAGIVIRFDEKTRMGEALPVTFVRQFLQTPADAGRSETVIVDDPSRAGDVTDTIVQDVGFQYADIKGSLQRSNYGVLVERYAAKVTRVFPFGGADGRLFPEDIVIAVNGKPLGPDSTLVDPVYGRLPFHVALKLEAGRMRESGGTVELEIARSKVIQKVSIVLRPFNVRNYRVSRTPAKPPFQVTGGIVFVELSDGYCREIGADARFDYLREASRYQETRTDERFVIAEMSLPVSENSGQGVHRLLLLSVNGSAVRSIAHLRELVEQAHTAGRLVVFGFEGNRTMVLDPEQLRSIDDEVRKRHGIQYLNELDS